MQRHLTTVFFSHFLNHAPPARPLLLLLDGHSTHQNPQFFTKAAREQVVVFCFPPNTTHLSQPLDKGTFGPLKSFWNEDCHMYLRSYPGEVINDYCFNRIFGRAWGRSMMMPNTVAAFHTTGIYPFNRAAVKTLDSVKSLREMTGLHFIPLLSPIPSRRTSKAQSEVEDNDKEVSSVGNLLVSDVLQCQSIISRFFPDCHMKTKAPEFYERTNTKILTEPELE